MTDRERLRRASIFNHLLAMKQHAEALERLLERPPDKARAAAWYQETRDFRDELKRRITS